MSVPGVEIATGLRPDGVHGARAVVDEIHVRHVDDAAKLERLLAILDAMLDKMPASREPASR